MKLIIREYLASLRERNELDALLPDLLSQMGLDVFSKPGIGNRQYGVDVAAFGSIEGGEEKVYLFSVKSGNLGRKDWNSGSVQDLQPSLDEIRDVYIPNYLPVAYKDKPIEVCICFGGNLKEDVRLNVSSYEEKYKTDLLSFSEWGGEKLSGYIEKYFLKEELLPKACRQSLRKSLAMLDEPETSLRHFRQLVLFLCNDTDKSPKEVLTSIRQLYLCLWVLFSWCREEDNLESAYLSTEFALLQSWQTSKIAFEKSDKVSTAILETLSSIQMLNLQVSSLFLETKVTPFTDKLYALSAAVRPSCGVDVNLKLFDIVGRLALCGLWAYWYVAKSDDSDMGKEIVKAFSKTIENYRVAIKQLISNNPILFTPYKDDQAIDVALAAWFLALDRNSHADLNAWLTQMTQQTSYLFQTNGKYPSTIRNYKELIEHPQKDTDEYRVSVTKASILYPLLSAFASVLKFTDLLSLMGSLKSEFLGHCNCQAWFLDEASELHLYKNDDNHGGVLSHLTVDDGDALLNEVFTECKNSPHFNELSVIKYQNWPMLLLACRHYRLPFPMHFLLELYEQIEGEEFVTDGEQEEETSSSDVNV